MLDKALDLAPGDKEIRGKKYLAAGHVSRIRGSSRANGKLLADARQKFEQAAELTGTTTPSIMEILHAAFREGQAFVALFTPDEEAVPVLSALGG